jgi:hypothetical protein
MIAPPIPLTAAEMALWRSAFERRPDLPAHDVPLLLLAAKLATQIEATGFYDDALASDFHACMTALRLTPLMRGLEQRAAVIATGHGAGRIASSTPASATRH